MRKKRILTQAMHSGGLDGTHWQIEVAILARGVEEEGHHDGATGDGHPGEQEAIHQGPVPGRHTLAARVSVTRPGAGGNIG